MTKKQKIRILIFSLFLLGGGLFICWQKGWLGNKNDSGSTSALDQILQGSSENQDEEETDEDEGEETLGADDPLNVPETESEAKKTSAYVVDKEVCENECVLYKDDPEALKYCQAVCGFAPTEGGRRETPDDCNNRTETDRDICLRDKAVAEKNASLCNDIIDQSLRQSCHNRVAEEYFDN